MPRKAINYQNTEMYKIVCDDLTVKYCYVGSTTDFTKRKCQHKSNCYNEKDKRYNLKVYTTIRENGGWDNWTMVLIEKYPCENKQQAEQRERFWYEQLNAEMNMKRPHITEEELKESQKEYMKEYHKEYKKVNQEKIKEWRENNKDKKKEYDKKYHEKNKEKKKEYYQANKEKRKEYDRERYALKKKLSAQ